MKWLVLLTFAAALLFFVDFGGLSSETPIIAKTELTVESIFEAAGARLNEALIKEIEEWRNLFVTQGFMSLYREVYRIAMDRQSFDFSRQLAAVSVLLIISHENLEVGPLQNSGKRLFIHFCRLSLLDSFFAFELTSLDAKNSLFSSDNVLLELWNDYLRQVWAKVVRQEVIRNRATTPENRAFAALMPEFLKDLEQIEAMPDDTDKSHEEDL